MEDNNMQNLSELQPGMVLAGGKYVIEKKIGEGGFGITYRALQSGLNRTVCIKEYFLAGRCVRDAQAHTIHIQGAGEDLFEKYRAAFVKESRTLATLHHPGIVEVIDVFDENNTSYMVMPFIEGRSLQSIVEENGPITYPEAVNYMAQIANAVGYIHDRHILHRDIKPDNIMITADYKAVLIDFGAAREYEEDKTQAQTSMVTHGYAPTEQYTRNSRKGAYTDIYAIGATLYFILTGKVPLEAAARITEVMPEPRELNPDLPEEANRTIMKAMQLKSQDRHQSIAEFMDDLRNVKPSSVQEDPVPQVKSAAPDGRGRKLFGVIAAAALVAIGVAVFFLFFNKDPLLEEAQSHKKEYEKAVLECKRRVVAKGEDGAALIEARDLLKNVVAPMEQRYSEIMPEVYNESKNFEDDLFKKLEKVANDYYEYARKLILNKGDAEDIIEALEWSLKIFENSKVRKELDDFKASIK